MDTPPLLFAVSGASGMPLTCAILSAWQEVAGLSVHLIVSENAKTVLATECNCSLSSLAAKEYAAADFSAPPASGSWPILGMVICPCSMATLAAIATGAGTNLIHRAADVTLKERRPLILVPRETPLNAIHLKNMLSLSRTGTIIMPFMPAFYTGQSSLPDLMRNFAGRILDELHIPNNLCKRWGDN